MPATTRMYRSPNYSGLKTNAYENYSWTLEEQLEAVKKNISELEEKQSRLQKESGSQHILIEKAKHQQDEAHLTAALLQPEEKNLFLPKIESTS